MRKIKFRAWDGCEFTFLDYSKIDIYRCGSFHGLQQYTGLKDRDGKDIYEGDILEFDRVEWGGDDNILNPVVYDEDNGEWCTGGGLNCECSTWKKIIGNVYESPELILST